MLRKKNVFEEIVAEIKRLIEIGVLPQGEKLPSVRAYALERRVNPNTVAKAYAKLEEDGYITVILKKGAYVAYRREGNIDCREEAKKRLGELRRLGITKEELFNLLNEVYDDKE